MQTLRPSLPSGMLGSLRYAAKSGWISEFPGGALLAALPLLSPLRPVLSKAAMAAMSGSKWVDH